MVKTHFLLDNFGNIRAILRYTKFSDLLKKAELNGLAAEFFTRQENRHMTIKFYSNARSKLRKPVSKV